MVFSDDESQHLHAALLSCHTLENNCNLTVKRKLMLVCRFLFTAMDGVPFMISEKFACASSDVSLFTTNQNPALLELYWL